MPILPENYQSLRSAEKQRILWENIKSTEYEEAKLPTQSMISYMLTVLYGGMLSMKHLHYTFLHASDVNEGRRIKVVHAYGSVCQVEMVSVAGHPFTGLFRSGAVGLVRIGLTAPLKSFTHGMAFKFFVDGHSSANVFLIPEIMGQGDDHNVFASKGTTRLKDFHGVLLTVLRLIFETALKTIKTQDVSWRLMTVKKLSLRTADGTPEEEPCTPIELLLEPTPEAQTSSAKRPDYRIKLKAIPPGTALYKLSGRLSEDSEWVPIGTIRSKSGFIASAFGDEKLFFQHDPGVES